MQTNQAKISPLEYKDDVIRMFFDVSVVCFVLLLLCLYIFFFFFVFFIVEAVSKHAIIQLSIKSIVNVINHKLTN